MGGEVPAIAQPDRPPIRFVGVHFPHVTGLLFVQFDHLPGLLLLFASISWRQRRNWSLGARFAGLLVMAVNSDGPTGCLGIAKASEIGRSPRSRCTQALAYRL